ANWRLYYNEQWVASHSVEENASLLIHEVSHLLREHDSRKRAAAARDSYTWNTAADCEIDADLAADGLPLPGNPPQPHSYGLQPGESVEVYYRHLYKPPPTPEEEAPQPGADDECDPSTRSGSSRAESRDDCGSGAHGDRRPWELPDDDGSSSG